jgi:S-adenosylmethionine synthetase
MNYIFTSESVSEGHPDKICDQVSDAVLDAVLSEDPTGRVACECFAATGMIVVGGEITTTSYINLQDLVREVIRDIGYTDPTLRFDADSCAVINVINRQSPDIALGVNSGGAGDQGMMFGYATKETSAYMPAPIYYSHRIMKKLADVRKKGRLMPYLRPDAKAQVSMVYNEDNEPISVDTIVVSTQHDPGVSNKRLITKNTTYHINPTGKFEIGGPHGDTGLTGRKIIVDTYGGRAPHGGGAFSGKDPTKVDRSAAYAARHLAKNLVAAGVARECTIQVAYAIGVAKPVSIHVNTHGTSVIPGHVIEDFIRKHVDLTPAGIIKRLDLLRPIYRPTAAYGHFGRNEFPWEQLDLVALFKNGLV